MIEEDELEIQEMIVEAGLTGDKELALQGFLLDPMIHGFDAGRQTFEELCQTQGGQQGSYGVSDGAARWR